jgi:hypothetical protein
VAFAEKTRFINRGVIPWNKSFCGVWGKGLEMCESRMNAAREIVKNQNDQDLENSMEDLLYYMAKKTIAVKTIQAHLARKFALIKTYGKSSRKNMTTN